MKKGNQGCPTHEVFFRVFLNSPVAGEKEAVIQHVLDCPRCRAKFRMMSGLQSELHALGNDLPEADLEGRDVREMRRLALGELRALSSSSKTGRARRPWLIPAAAAAALLLCIAGTMTIFRSKASDIQRSVTNHELRLLKPAGRIKGAPELFVWTPVSNCERYKFELIDSDLNTIGNVMIVKKTQVQLTSKERGKIIPGKTFIWTVEAYDENDNKVDEALQSFEIK